MIVNQPIQHKVYDCNNPLEQFRHNGYYIVGDYVFNYRLNALEFASANDLPVHWEFNTDVYRQIDWKKPPKIGLHEAYRRRAQQLRDKYDYLILAFSGGADSSNILDTFLENQIPLDEVITEWPNKMIPDRPPKDLTTEPKNYIYEWHQRIKPALAYLAQQHPKIKISKLDQTDVMSLEDFEDTCIIVNHHALASVKRWRSVDSRLKDICRNHKRVGLIVGTEKPVIHIDRQIFCVQFKDSHCWNKSNVSDFAKNIEYFYWSRDVPEIVHVQAHEIYNYLCRRPDHIHLFDFRQRPDPKTRYRDHKLYWRLQADLIKRIIYPTWNPLIYQADKPDSMIYSDHYSLLALEKNSLEWQSWDSNVRSRMALIDKKFIDVIELDANKIRLKNYKSFFSRLYPVGRLPTITESPNTVDASDSWHYI